MGPFPEQSTQRTENSESPSRLGRSLFTPPARRGLLDFMQSGARNPFAGNKLGPKCPVWCMYSYTCQGDRRSRKIKHGPFALTFPAKFRRFGIFPMRASAVEMQHLPGSGTAQTQHLLFESAELLLRLEEHLQIVIPLSPDLFEIL